MLTIPLSKVPYREPKSRSVFSKAAKQEESAASRDAFQRAESSQPLTRHEVRQTERGWKGRVYNAVKTAGWMTAFAVSAKLLGTPGMFLVPTALAAKATSDFIRNGGFREMSKTKKLLLGAGLTLAVGALGTMPFTVGLLPAALLSKVGVPLLVGAAATGAAIGAISEDAPVKFLVEDNAKPEAVKASEPEKNLVIGAKMRFPGEIFEISPETGTAKTSHDLVLIPTEQMERAENLGAVKPEFRSRVAAEEDGIQIETRVAKAWMITEKEREQVSLAAIAEVPKALFVHNSETQGYDPEYDFVMMPKGTKDQQEELGALPVELKSSMLEPVNSPVSMIFARANEPSQTSQ